MDHRTTERLQAHIASAIRQALDEERADMLANLPATGLVQRGAVLRAMRVYLGKNQEAVASESGVSARTVATAERGEGVSDRTWHALLAFFATKGLTWDGRAMTVEE